uniref:Uncharacterized protein n=1 Tax=Oryza nivara TaxID=4536 RepID=A0A0E0IBH5_ORYNI
MAVGGRMTAKPGVVTTDQERALPESRTTATDAPEAAGLEVTTVAPHPSLYLATSNMINMLQCLCFHEGLYPWQAAPGLWASGGPAIWASGNRKGSNQANKMNLWHGSRSTCRSHKGSPGQKARSSSYKEPGTAQELPHQLLHKSKAMDMFAQMLQVKWMRCYYWVMLLCDALGSSCCC